MATTPTTTTTTPPSTPVLHVINVDYLNESWCELQYKSGCSSTGSISHLNHSVNPEVLEKLLQEAQKELSPLPKCDLHYSPMSSIFYQDISPSSSIKQIEKSNFSVPKNTHKINSIPNKIVKTTVIDNSNKNLVHLNPSNSIKPILKSNITVYDDIYDDDDDVDLEYVEDDTYDENNFDKEITSVPGAPGPAVSTPCQNCIKHKKQIELLIEKQIDNQKEFIKIKNDFEVKLLNKSLEISCSSSTPTVAAVSPMRNDKSMCTSPILCSSKSGVNTPDKNAAISSNDWIKYFSSRPQAHPPKEWNFVHPNSSKSKIDNLRKNMNEDILSDKSSEQLNYNSLVNSFKGLSKENIGKFLFTHMASFIVGATLMFLVLKRHLNIRNSVYFI